MGRNLASKAGAKPEAREVLEEFPGVRCFLWPGLARHARFSLADQTLRASLQNLEKRLTCCKIKPQMVETLKLQQLALCFGRVWSFWSLGISGKYK